MLKKHKNKLKVLGILIGVAVLLYYSNTVRADAGWFLSAKAIFWQEMFETIFRALMIGTVVALILKYMK